MLNQICIMGRFTQDPEVRKTTSGLSVCSFTIANDKNTKRDDNTPPNWVDCVAWRERADNIAKFFHKGSLIVITGNLQTRQYQDKNGNNRKATEVVVDRFDFCESKRQDSVGEPMAQQPAQAAPVSYSSADASDFTVTGDAEDDLPF